MRSSASLAMGTLPLTYNHAEAAPAKCQRYCAANADVSMPEIDGFEFARMVRGHPRFARTPIIFVSAFAQSELDQLDGYDTGAVDYVSVPVSAPIFRAKAKVSRSGYPAPGIGDAQAETRSSCRRTNGGA
jgi:CheY-like chemotaxis protein